MPRQQLLQRFYHGHSLLQLQRLPVFGESVQRNRQHRVLRVHRVSRQSVRGDRLQLNRKHCLQAEVIELFVEPQLFVVELIEPQLFVELIEPQFFVEFI